MSEQLEINSSEMYPQSHALGFDYIKEREQKRSSEYISLDDLHLYGDDLNHFRENFEYLYQTLKEQIKDFINKNPEYKLNFINLHEYPYNNCNDIHCPNTPYNLEISYIRYETESEFLIRKEKENIRNKKDKESLKNQIQKMINSNIINKEELEEFINNKVHGDNNE